MQSKEFGCNLKGGLDFLSQRWLAVAWCIVAFLFAGEAGATELRIRFQGPNHEPIPIKRAQLLLVNWGFTDQIELPTEGDLLRLTLDPSWLQSRRTESGPPRFGVSVYVQADGYAGIRSEFFALLFGETPENTVTETEIDFRQGNPVVVRAGEQRKMLVTLRRPIPRRVRFVDEEKKPVRDIKVSAGMFWSNENHCGRLAGFDPLIRSASPDAQGVVTVPDGDFEYAISVSGPHLAIEGEPASGEGYLTTSLTSPETVVPIHRFRRRPLSMLVLAGGGPLKGAPLWADQHCGVCAASNGIVATSDERGRIRKEDFYPEEAGDICFVDKSGKQVWGLQAERLEPGIITVRLAPGTVLETQEGRCDVSP